MPLVSVENVAPGIRLGLWRIESESTDIYALYPALRNLDTDGVKSKSRLLEKLSVAALICEMTGVECPEIGHKVNGAPLLDGFQIGISHTHSYAAVILSQDVDVAVDIEYRSERVKRIVSKFVRNDEQSESLDRLLLNWCAKETVYKLLNAENLGYFDMRLKPFSISDEGKFLVEDLKGKQSVWLNYRITPDYTLTFSFLS